MSVAWSSAAWRSSGFSLSAGSPRALRSRLCRHSTAERTSSRLAWVGATPAPAQRARLAVAPAWSAVTSSTHAQAASMSRNRVTARWTMCA